jgi:hypothetical protein
MKRTNMIFLLLLLCLSLLWGCGRVESDQPDGGAESGGDETTSQPEPSATDFVFAFSYRVEQTQYIGGEVIAITATVKNISGVTYSYTGSSSAFIPDIVLSTKSGDGNRTYRLVSDPIAMTNDYVLHNIADGKEGSVTYTFPIPADAACGMYDLQLSFEDDKQIFPAVLEILPSGQQKENPQYSYSLGAVYSGNDSIHPIECLVYTEEYKDGKCVLSGDGDGVFRIFNDPAAKHTDFPVLVLDGAVTVSFPTNYTLVSVTLYDLQYNEIDEVNLESLSSLSAGEYLVVITARYNGNGGDLSVKDYYITATDNLIKLVVRG